MTLAPPSYIETPHVAYVNFFIGGKCITKYEDLRRPRSLQSFSFENSADEAGKFRLQVVDPTWSVIEQSIVDAGFTKEVEFDWGYENGGIRSRHWKGFITSAIPSFTIDGIMLTIEGTGSLGKLAVVKKTDTYPNSIRDGSDAFKRPDEWVEIIAKRHGFTVDIEPCREIKVVDAFAGTEPVKMRYTQQRMTDLQFIKNVLAPVSVSAKTGEAGYIVYVDEKDVLHFKPAAKSKRPAEIFYYMRKKDSEVISFDVDYEGWILPTIKGFEKVTVPVIDAITGQIGLVEKHNDNTPEKVKLAGYKVPNPYTVALRTKQASGLISTLPEKNIEVAEARALSKYFQAWNAAGVNAKLTIVGTDKDTLQLNNTCTVIVKTPTGELHHTSGNYFIVGKADEIAGGRWTTTLSLQREGPRGSGEPANAKDNTGL